MPRPLVTQVANAWYCIHIPYHTILAGFLITRICYWNQHISVHESWTNFERIEGEKTPEKLDTKNNEYTFTVYETRCKFKKICTAFKTKVKISCFD